MRIKLGKPKLCNEYDIHAEITTVSFSSFQFIFKLRTKNDNNNQHHALSVYFPSHIHPLSLMLQPCK